MAKQPGVWLRKNRGWYTTLNGKQVWLAESTATKTQAIAVLRQVAAAEDKGEHRRPAGRLVGDLVVPFLRNCEARVEAKELAPLTLEGYRRFLVPAGLALGRYPAASLQPAHVEAWLKTKAKWGATTRNNAITAVQAMLNWAARGKLIGLNPIKEMRKPAARASETDLSPEKSRAVLAAFSDRPFLDLLTVLFGTGARPSEAYRMEARHLKLEDGLAEMEGKTTGVTGHRRVIYLSGPAVEVLARLAGEHPEGPLLRNRSGRPWTRNATALRFQRLRKRLGLGKEATAKAFRSAFVTDGLENGVPIATVSALVGHTSTRMVEKHYSRLRERRDHLREAARKVRPGPTDQECTS